MLSCHSFATSYGFLTVFSFPLHFTPELVSFHWLSVRFGIDFKISLITFKAFMACLPVIYRTRKRTRHIQGLLSVQEAWLKTIGDRPFAVRVPRL